jgi:hypothetical protein
MATNSSSLVVKISADLNDFSKKLNQMTKDVEKASKKVESVGKALTIGITVPVTAAAVALAKMAAENEDVGARVQRVFGSMASSVNASIQNMMQSVPETQTDLQKMAVSLDNMAQGMGLAPQNAARMSESLLKLAGDASAFAHVPMEQALDALEHGLAGRTKGLLEFGIAINETDIKQRAYQMGILHTGHDLTETGTALAAYSLIMERSSRIQGEGARTADQMGKSFSFLKRDFAELADNVSALVLPTLSDLAKIALGVVDALSKVPAPITRVVFAAAGLAAVIGPFVYVVPKVIAVFSKLGAAFTLLRGVAFIGPIIAAITGPIGIAVGAVIAVTAALYGLYKIWQRFHDGGPQDSMAPGKVIGPVTFKQIGQGEAGAKLAAAANEPTERLSGTPLEQFKKAADEVTRGFDAAVEHGRPVEGMMARVNKLHTEAAQLIRAQGGAFNETAQAAQEVLDKLQQIKNATELAAATTDEQRNAIITRIARDQRGGFNAGQQAANEVAKGAFDQSRDLETRQAKLALPKLEQSAPFIHGKAFVDFQEQEQAAEAALKYREAMVQLVPTFDAARVAAVEFAETQMQYTNDLATRLELSNKPSIFDAGTEAKIQVNNNAKGYTDDLALRENMLKLSNTVSGLPPGFDAARQAAVEFAESQQQTTEQVALRFEHIRLSLDQFGIHLGNLSGRMQVVTGIIYDAAINFAQSLVANAGGSGKGAGIGRGLGGLAGAIAGALLGPAGSVAGAVIGSTIGGLVGTGLGGLIGGAFDNNKKSVDSNTAALNAMAHAWIKVTASVTNAPEFFKVQQYRFDAAPTFPFLPYDPRRSTDLPGNGPAGWSPNGGKSGDTYNVHIQNLNTVASNTKQLLDDLVRQNLKTKGTGTPATFAFG